MKIIHIQYPYVITDTGQQVDIDAINGHAKLGAELEEEFFEGKEKGQYASGYYNILAVTSDSECVSGVCPVR